MGSQSHAGSGKAGGVLGWTKLFLITTILTSVTGFGFPFHGFTPAIGVGIISLVVLAIALYGDDQTSQPAQNASCGRCGPI